MGQDYSLLMHQSLVSLGEQTVLVRSAESQTHWIGEQCKELSSDELLLSTVAIVIRGIEMGGRRHITYTMKCIIYAYCS